MFGIGMPEMLLILAVALIIIGPKKLPELAKTLGRALGDFKRATNDLKDSIEMETGLDDVRDDIYSAKENLKASVSLDPDAPASKPTGEKKSSASDAPMEQVKDAFDSLNTEDPSADESPDGDAGGQDPHPGDKAAK